MTTVLFYKFPRWKTITKEKMSEEMKKEEVKKEKRSEEEIILELHSSITAAREHFQRVMQLLHDGSKNSDYLKSLVITTSPHALPVTKGMLVFDLNIQASVDLINTGHFEKMKSMNQEQRSQYLINLSELLFSGGKL